MTIADLIPAGCSVEVCGSVATVHDGRGVVIAIICAERNNAELARLIAAIPSLVDAIETSIERGMLMPILYGLRNLDRAVFQPELLPAA